MSADYTARATATGGRGGRARTDDGKIDLALSSPGAGGAGTNPEQLFAAGYAACFGGAVQFLAKQKGIELGEVTTHCDVILHKTDQGFHLGVIMDTELPGMDEDKARDLINATHDFCPYSKAVRGNIVVTLKVNGKPL